MFLYFLHGLVSSFITIMVFFCCQNDRSLAKILSEFLEPWSLLEFQEPLCWTDGSNPFFCMHEYRTAALFNARNCLQWARVELSDPTHLMLSRLTGTRGWRKNDVARCSSESILMFICLSGQFLANGCLARRCWYSVVRSMIQKVARL